MGFISVRVLFILGFVFVGLCIVISLFSVLSRPPIVDHQQSFTLTDELETIGEVSLKERTYLLWTEDIIDGDEDDYLYLYVWNLYQDPVDYHAGRPIYMEHEGVRYQLYSGLDVEYGNDFFIEARSREPSMEGGDYELMITHQEDGEPGVRTTVYGLLIIGMVLIVEPFSRWRWGKD